MTNVWSPWLEDAETMARINTLSSMDFAFWATTFTSVDVMRDDGIEGDDDIGSLISWAAGQVGLDLPTTTPAIQALCTTVLSPADALQIRGALIFDNEGTAGITMGLNDVISLYSGSYVMSRFDPVNDQWLYGSRVPGLDY